MIRVMTESPSGATGPRRLLRSRDERVLGGVCGGIGEYLGVDPVLIRLAAVLLVFAGGAGVIAYIVAWIVIPEEPEGAAHEPGAAKASGQDEEMQGRARVIAGAVLAGLGGLLLLDILLPFSFDHDLIWPVLLIVIGAAVIARGTTR